MEPHDMGEYFGQRPQSRMSTSGTIPGEEEELGFERSTEIGEKAQGVGSMFCVEFTPCKPPTESFP